MITVCAAFDRSWALPAAFCLFAFAGFSHADSEDCGGCRYENDEWLSEAMQAAINDASSKPGWRTGAKLKRLGKRSKDVARCARLETQDGWMALCWTGKTDRRTYQLFLEKTGKVEELREKEKIEIKTGCDDNQLLKFEIRNYTHDEVAPSLAVPVCLAECQSEGVFRFCTSWSTGSNKAGSDRAGSDSVEGVVDWLKERAQFSDGCAGLMTFYDCALSKKGRGVKISVETKDGSGEKKTTELFSFPLDVDQSDKVRETINKWMKTARWK